MIDNEEVQELWAGLFAASCTGEGQDDENLIFVDLLKQLTIAEARIIKYACETARKVVYKTGLVVSHSLDLHCDELLKLTGIKDFHRLDRELDHLRSLELIGGAGHGGFIAGASELIADIQPTALALNLYVRSQGFSISTAEFWKIELITEDDLLKENQEIARHAAEKIKQEQHTKQQQKNP